MISRRVSGGLIVSSKHLEQQPTTNPKVPPHLRLVIPVVFSQKTEMSVCSGFPLENSQAPRPSSERTGMSGMWPITGCQSVSAGGENSPARENVVRKERELP